MTVKLLDGRTWRGDTVINELTRRYLIQQDENKVLGENAESMTFAGLPKKGDAHPVHSGLYVTEISFAEGSGYEKNTIIATVTYGRISVEGETEGFAGCAVDSWGWDASTEEKELVTAADGTKVLNSAGDVFDNVPKVSAPAPVFTKVMRFKQRQSGVMAYNCCTNSGSITIGGYSFPKGSLLCTVFETRLFGDEEYKYQYTVQLKYKSNPVRVGGASTVTDVGWDVAIIDAGMREKKDGKLSRIKVIDGETGKVCTVTSPELLDGSGAAVDRTGGEVSPYVMRYTAYPTASFPTWFYSEPS